MNIIHTSVAEKEVEKLLRQFLPDTIFANKTYAVGGYVRDEYIRQVSGDTSTRPKDLDIVVEIQGGSQKITHILKEEFGDSISTPIQMGAYPIWQITFKKDIEKFKTKGAIIEFADTMEEEFPNKDSRQREVKYASLRKDIERRDLTINMLLKNLTTGKIEDLTEMSKNDIEKGILRHINNILLEKRFREDPLRLMRLIRFQAIYEWNIPKSVLRIAKKNAHRIKIVSNERIMAELRKTMERGKLKRAIRLMKTIDILKHILPEVEALRGITQGEKYHQEGDVYKHTLKVLENAKPGIENQMAALLHDIGKPATQQILPDKTTFLEHQYAGAKITRIIMKRLKFDKKTIDKVVMLVKCHMDPLFKLNASNKNLRKYMRDIGDEALDPILDLARADELGRLPQRDEIPTLMKRVEEIRKAPIKIEKKSILNGIEIMGLTGIRPGPVVGKAKEYLFWLQDNYASKNKVLTRVEAKQLLQKKFKK